MSSARIEHLEGTEHACVAFICVSQLGLQVQTC